MYSYDSRVGFSMCDADQKLTINAMVDFFQDAATFQSEDLGVGMSYLFPLNLMWVINTWQIDVKRYPKCMEKIKVVTIPYKFRGFVGYRYFRIESEAGETLVDANSMWCLLNFETMTPSNAPEKLPEKYGENAKPEMDYCNGKIRLPENATEQEPIVVDSFFLDPNRHVNNGQYVNIAMNYLPEGFVIDRMRAEYRQQAFLGCTLHPVVGEIGPGVWAIHINDDNGKPYAAVELTGHVATQY